MRLRRTAWAAGLVGGLSLLLSAWTEPTSFVTFATTGGDAWTFDKEITGTVAPGQCDEVEIRTPAGMTTVRPADVRFSAHVNLWSGPNELVADCLAGGQRQGTPARQRWNVRLADRPTARVRVTVSDGIVSFDAGDSEPGRARHAAIRDYAWRVRQGNPAPLSGLPAHGARVTLPAPAVDGEYYVILRATDALSRSDESTAVFRVRGGRAELVDTTREHAGWIDRAVVYGVVPSLLGPRGLRAVTASLDRIAALGANTLWISPITAAPPGDFGYAVTDEFQINPRDGTLGDLRALVDAAHARHLRVILDLVANHLSDHSRYFTDTVRRQHGSPYFDYFARDPAGEAAHYFDWSNLENLNYDNPEVRRMMIAAAARWVRDFDVDGFRVDAAWGPAERRPDFWKQWSGELKRIKPDLLLLAEAPAANPQYSTSGFAAAYDWTDKLGEWAWRAPFDDPPHTAADLRAAIARTMSDTGLVFRFLNNNDTGARFASRYGVERTRVAAAMQMTLPGLPGLFMGDETGAAFEPYTPSPPVDWADRSGLEAWYRALLRLRGDQPALRSAEMAMLDVAPHDDVLAYVRRTPDRRDELVVLLNYGGAAADLALPNAVASELGGTVQDLLSGEDMPAATIRLAPYGVRILRRAPPVRAAARDAD